MWSSYLDLNATGKAKERNMYSMEKEKKPGKMKAALEGGNPWF